LTWAGEYLWVSDFNGHIYKVDVGLSATAAERVGDIPERYDLHQNYPNPFNPSTLISFELPEATVAEINVYDLAGRRVIQLVSGQFAAGRYEARLDATGLPSGVYLYRLETPSYSQTQTLVFAK